LTRVYKRKWKTGTGYRVVFKDTLGKEHQRQFKNKLAAMSFVETLSTQTDPSRMTVAAALDIWLTTVKTVGRNGRPPVSKSTWQAYESLITHHISPYLGARFVARLRGPDIVQFRKQLLEDLSRAMAKKALSTLSMMMNEMVTQGVIASNPCLAVKIHNHTTEKSKVSIPSKMHVTRVLTCGKFTDNDRFFIKTLVASGMRVSEAIALQCRHFDLDQGTILIEQRMASVDHSVGPLKSRGSYRTIYIPTDLAGSLRPFLGRREGFAFLAQEGCAMTYNNFMNRTWRPTLEEIKVPKFGLHGLRHFHASLMIENGADVKMVQEQLGHSDPGFTLRVYGHLFEKTQEQRRREADRLMAGLDLDAAPVQNQDI
jgi:integrase